MTIINMMCMLVLVMGSAFLTSVHKKGTFLVDREKRVPIEVLKKANRDSRQLFAAKIAAVLIALVSAALFFLTEDLNAESLRFYNNWSPHHVVLLLLFGVAVLIGVRGIEKDAPEPKE